MASRWIARDFGRIVRKSLLATQTLIAVKGRSSSVSFQYPDVSVNGSRNAELPHAIRVGGGKEGLLASRWVAPISVGSPRNHRPPSTISRPRHPDPNRG